MPGPNEPASFTQLAERSFQAKVENGWLDRGDAEFTIEAVAGPEGDNSVGQAFFVNGMPAGSGPIKTYYPIGGRTDTAFYLYIRGFRVSANWDGQDDGINKIFFAAHAGGPGIFVQVKGAGAGTLHFRCNTQLPSTVQTRDYELGQLATGMVDYVCVRGTFYDIELRCEENLVGSEDTGRIRMWVKESAQTDASWVLVADSNVEVPTYDAGAFAGLVFWDLGNDHFFNGEPSWNPTYGGGAGSVGNDQTQQMDYAYISVGAAGATSQPNPSLDGYSSGSGLGVEARWFHAGGSAPKGAIVFARLPLTADNIITSVKYGGIPMPLKASVVKATGEPMRLQMYALENSVPPGVQEVEILTSAGTAIIGDCFTVNTDDNRNIEFVDIDATLNSDSQANPSVNLSLNARNCFCGLSFVSGHDISASVTPLAGWTVGAQGVAGGSTTGAYRYDTTAALDVTAGFNQAAEDVVAIAFAVAQRAASRQRRRWWWWNL